MTSHITWCHQYSATVYLKIKVCVEWVSELEALHFNMLHDHFSTTLYHHYSTVLPTLHDHYSTIIFIIIKKGQQCKAGREWYTPYQSEDPSSTIPTYRQKEEKGKESRRL